jgi:hypothetical protein
MNIAHLNKAKVLATLYNNAKPQGLGMSQYTPEQMSEKEAASLLEQTTYFDYLKGRLMKINLSGDELDTFLYNRDNGHNAAEKALERLQD